MIGPGAMGRVSGFLPRAGLVGSALTTVCCLGVSSAISLASAVGATFLTRDATLQPLLTAMLAVTVAGSAWSARRHRSLPPFLLSVIASALVYSALYGPLANGIGASGGPHHSDHGAMHDAMATAARSHGGISSTVLVWIGLAVLLVAQLWDVRQVRHCAAARAITTRTEGVT